MPTTSGDPKKSASELRPDLQPEPIGQRQSTRSRIFVCAAILLAVVIVGGRETYRILNDPQIYFLRDEAGAKWIRANEPCSYALRRASQSPTVFECRFATIAAVQNARMSIRAFRRCIVELDQKPLEIGARDANAWKEPSEFVIAGPVAPGAHQLQIAVFNSDAHPCVLASSTQLGIQTGSDWVTVGKNGQRVPAILAAQVKLFDEAMLYPSVQDAFISRAPWLAAAFILALAWILWNSRPARLNATESCLRVTPALLRWILLAAWVVLAANNIWQVPSGVGPDLFAHYQYVVYIARSWSLPLATDGWQMFQSPLFYTMAAPWYGLLSSRLGADDIVKILRFLPLLCGLAQIEIVYRTSRAVFPYRNDLQMLATTIGGLMPINIYSSQVLGNEPLAGCLTALLILLSVSLVVEPLRTRSQGFFVVMGLVWGLAILSKVTALLQAPLLIGVIAVHGRKLGSTRGAILTHGSLVFLTCFVTAGWWFLRNWARLGTPIGTTFTGGNVWWQDPSYRTVQQLTSFGISLSRPLYDQVWSLWDSLYSSLWLDGFGSALLVAPQDFPWNVNWMLAGAWLGVIPMAFLLFSPVACLRRELGPSRNALLFALAAVGVYLTAILDLYIALPVLAAGKATYTLGLLPCYAVLAAAGAAPLLRFRLLRAVICSAVTCWAVAAYLAYFSTNYWRHGWGTGP
jgi:hypothetical protein